MHSGTLGEVEGWDVSHQNLAFPVLKRLCPGGALKAEVAVRQPRGRPPPPRPPLESPALCLLSPGGAQAEAACLKGSPLQRPTQEPQ